MQKWHVVDSPEKRTNKFVLFSVKSKKANKTNLFIHFFVRIYGALILLLVLSDLYIAG